MKYDVSLITFIAFLGFFTPYFLLWFALPFLPDSWLIALLPVMEFYLNVLPIGEKV